MWEKKYISISYTSQWLTQMHTPALFFRIDESANSFTNISLFVIHFLLVYTFQVTQEITNSLYIDIFNKISLNKTNKEATLQTQCTFCCEKQNICSTLWGIKASGPLLRMEASYFVDTILTGKIKDSRAATVKESYINITEIKDNTCRSLPLNLPSRTYNV